MAGDENDRPRTLGRRLSNFLQEVVHVQRCGDELIPPRQSVQATSPRLLVLGTGMGSLDEPPIHNTSHTGSQNKQGMHGRPPPGVGPSRRMIVDGGRSECPHHPVVNRHLPYGEQERQPLLIKCDDGQHDKEVKVQLDVASRQVHEHPRGGHDRRIGEAMPQALPGKHPRTRNTEHMELQQDEDATVSAFPDRIR